MIAGDSSFPLTAGLGSLLGAVVGFLGGRRFLASILVGTVLGGALAWLVAGFDKILWVLERVRLWVGFWGCKFRCYWICELRGSLRRRQVDLSYTITEPNREAARIMENRGVLIGSIIFVFASFILMIGGLVYESYKAKQIRQLALSITTETKSVEVSTAQDFSMYKTLDWRRRAGDGSNPRRSVRDGQSR